MAASTITSILAPAVCKYKVRWTGENGIEGESSEPMPFYLAEHLAQHAAQAYPNLTFEVVLGDSEET